jgi:hypothetical protein
MQIRKQIVRLSPTITAIVAVIALVVSIRSYQRAQESIKIAKESLKSSKEFFISENRPFITLQPSRFEETDSFLKISSKGKIVSAEMKYEMKNVGNQPAKDISLPHVFGIKAGLKKGTPVTINLPSKFTLGPGESVFMSITTKIGFDTDSIGNYVEGLASKGITLQMIVFYLSELEPSKRYKTKVANKIYKDRAIILGSEMK